MYVILIIPTNIWIKRNLESPISNAPRRWRVTRSIESQGCIGSQEGGVRCQVLDFSASHEEVERSSTGSLSQGAVPKEAPGVISEWSIYPCPSLFLSLSLSFPLANSFSLTTGVRTWFAVGINGCQAGRLVLSSQLSHIPLPRTVQLTIKSLSPIHHHHHHHHHLSLSLLSSRRSYSRSLLGRRWTLDYPINTTSPCVHPSRRIFNYLNAEREPRRRPGMK